jgi:hypothetical protein
MIIKSNRDNQNRVKSIQFDKNSIKDISNQAET